MVTTGVLKIYILVFLSTPVGQKMLQTVKKFN